MTDKVKAIRTNAHFIVQCPICDDSSDDLDGMICEQCGKSFTNNEVMYCVGDDDEVIGHFHEGCLHKKLLK